MHNLQAEHIPDFSTSQGDPLAGERRGSGADSTGPGSGTPPSVWATYYQMADLRAEIQRDLDRLFVDGAPSEQHFFTPPRQQLLLTVLYLWSRLHFPKPSYRQGMHELLAPLLFVLEADAAALRASSSDAVEAGGGSSTDSSSSSSSNHALLLGLFPDLAASDNALEADCFALFESLMDDMAPW
jgi:hypothetical protein